MPLLIIHNCIRIECQLIKFLQSESAQVVLRLRNPAPDQIGRDSLTDSRTVFLRFPHLAETINFESEVSNEGHTHVWRDGSQNWTNEISEVNQPILIFVA